MIVVDASVVIEVLSNTSAGIQFAERVFDPDETLHAPHVLDVEVAQVLRRYTRTGEVDAARGSRHSKILWIPPQCPATPKSYGAMIQAISADHGGEVLARRLSPSYNGVDVGLESVQRG